MNLMKFVVKSIKVFLIDWKQRKNQEIIWRDLL